MIRTLDPPLLAKAAGRSTQGVLHGGSFKRLITAPQVGIRPDGTVAEGFDDQVDQALDNLMTVLRAAGLGPGDIVRLSIHSVVAGSAAACVKRREMKLDLPRAIMIYREVAGFARPDCLVEIDCEAVREVPNG